MFEKEFPQEEKKESERLSQEREDDDREEIKPAGPVYGINSDADDVEEKDDSKKKKKKGKCVIFWVWLTEVYITLLLLAATKESYLHKINKEKYLAATFRS